MFSTNITQKRFITVFSIGSINSDGNVLFQQLLRVLKVQNLYQNWVFLHQRWTTCFWLSSRLPYQWPLQTSDINLVNVRRKNSLKTALCQRLTPWFETLKFSFSIFRFSFVNRKIVAVLLRQILIHLSALPWVLFFGHVRKKKKKWPWWVRFLHNKRWHVACGL